MQFILNSEIFNLIHKIVNNAGVLNKYIYSFIYYKNNSNNNNNNNNN